MCSKNLAVTPFVLACLGGALISLPSAARPAVPAAAEPSCSRESLAPKAVWLSDAMWLPRLGKILAVDAGRNKLVLYSPNGNGDIAPEPEGEYPTLVAASGDRILLELVGREVVSLDGDLRERQTLTFLKNLSTPLGQLSEVNQWTAGGDDSVLVFGHVRGANLPRGFQPGLFRIPTTGSNHAAQLLLKVNAWDYYVLGYQYLASLDNMGYFLDLDHEARLYEIAPGALPRLLPDAVPPRFRGVPTINAKMNGPADAPVLFGKLESLKMLTGLYGDSAHAKLYLLAREPAAKGATDWWLYRVDPRLGRVEGKAHLPTRAKFLSIVVSPENLYLIERGDVDALAAQEISTMVRVPMQLLEQAPLEGAEVCPRLRP